ncbi:MAG: ribonuclease III [Alphaproteobacteria bacterium]|nr:ribonuclease III [Alphaproteobacteria bacterium]
MAVGHPLRPHFSDRSLTVTAGHNSNSLGSALCLELGHEFKDEEVLRHALTHPSAVASARWRATPYERLEFLGDRVLGLVVADMLLARFPDEKEGALAQRHAALVRKETLARVARTIGLETYLILSKGEMESGGRSNPSTLADACEAVIGALFTDGGFAPSAAFIRRLWSPLMDEAATPPKDAKTALQEWAQGQGRPLPIYEVLRMEGPPHDPVFSVKVSVEGEAHATATATATGPTKRVAEQVAAQSLLEKVR